MESSHWRGLVLPIGSVASEPLLTVQALKQSGFQQGLIDPFLIDQERFEQAWIRSRLSQCNRLARGDRIRRETKPKPSSSWQFTLNHPALATHNRSFTLDQGKADRRLLALGQGFGE